MGIGNLAVACLGVVSYASTLWAMSALLAFNSNFANHFPATSPFLPFTVDSPTPPPSPPPLPSAAATLAANLAAWLPFILAHSAFARCATKTALTRVGLPASAERAFYCLQSALLLTAGLAAWRPLDAPTLWRAPPPLHAPLWALHIAAITFSAVSVSEADADMLGLKRALAAKAKEDASVAPPKLQTEGYYAWVRHPGVAGSLVAFWAQPVMTAGHLALVLFLGGYQIGATLLLEERDLAATFGDDWEHYKARVPPFVPWRRATSGAKAASSGTAAASGGGGGGSAAAKKEL